MPSPYRVPKLDGNNKLPVKYVPDPASIGAATPADLTAGLAGKVNSSTYTAGLAAKQDVATLGATVAADATVKTAFGHPLAILTPELFGAVGDGTTDDTTAVQAAFSAVPATGGWVHLGKTYKVTSGITCANPVKVTGVGGVTTAFGALSGLLCAIDAIDVLTLNGAGGNVCRDFGIIWTGTIGAPTAGSGLRIAGASAGDYFVADNVSVSGFWNCLQVDTGFYYQITSCKILDPVNYGIYLRNTESGGTDHGDQVIANCVFSKVRDTINRGTGVRWETGGGLKFTGNKFNAGTQVGYPSTGMLTYCVYMHLTGTQTSVLLFSGNSIENPITAGVMVDGAAATQFSKIVITGNEFYKGTNAVNINGTGMTSMQDVVLSGNIFTAAGIALTNISKVTLSGNVVDSGSALLALSGVKQIVGLNGNMWNTGGTAIISDTDQNTTTATAGHVRDNWELRSEVSALTSSANYGSITPGTFSSAVATIDFEGNVSGVGSVYLRQARQITYTNTGAAVVGATIGTDLAFGPAAAEITITWDVTTTPKLSPKLTSVNARSTTGYLKMRYEGPAAAVNYA